MQRAYKAATKASIDELEALEGRIAEREANGEPPSDTILWMRQRIIDNINELGRNLQAFADEGTQITTDGQTQAATLANDATQSLVEAAAGKKPANVSIGTSWTNLPDEQLQAFVGFAGDGSPLAELFNKIPQVTTNAMQMALVQGISLGEGPRTVARRVRKAADIGRYRAETIARTEMIRSAREAQRQLYMQNPAVQGYRRQATQDSRVCLACLALSGTLSATDEIMPSHPNCRCVMVPVTMSWAEITGDSSIPDTRPPVATPERILAGLSDADKVAIMGPARYQMYKDGKSLLDMVQIKQDENWGPTTSVLPIRNIGGSLSVKPPKTPKQLVNPKPVEIVKPSINRDPQALLEEFRKLRPSLRSKEQIDADYQAYETERQAFLQTYRDAKLDVIDGIKEWHKNHGDRLKALKDEQKGIARIPQDVLEKMHQLMFSDDPISPTTNFPKKALLSSGQNVMPREYEQPVNDALNYVAKFIDKRPFTNHTKLLAEGIDLNEVNLAIHNRKNAYGYCEWEDLGIIALNKKELVFTETFNKNFNTTTYSRTLAHELMHWIDNRDAQMRKRVSDFFLMRTKDDAGWYKSQYGGAYKPDKWPDPYCGQRYSDFERTMGYGLEVPTRGMEYLLSNPLRFAEEDFEYFSFMITEVLGTGK